jgi:hypothetical protein
MSSTEERLSRASAAGKRASASPMERDQKFSGFTRLYWLAGYGVIAYAAVRVHGWLSLALWVYVVVSVSMNLFFWKVVRKLRHRKMLLAREQVHRVRQLDASNPVALGLGHLFDADPGLDRLSAEAGVRFALARVNAVLDEVDATTPEPSLWGYTIGDDGKATKAPK